MLYAIVGVILGIIGGAFLPLGIPMDYSRYTAVAILAILDALIAAICSQIKKEFQVSGFIINLVFYVFLAAFFVYLGDKLNLDLYIGIIVVFMFRIIQNISVLKNFYFKKFFKDDKKDQDLHLDY